MIAPIEQGYRSERLTADEAAHIAAQKAAADASQDSVVTRLIGDHPVAAVAAAATLGVVLGWVIKRR